MTKSANCHDSITVQILCYFLVQKHPLRVCYPLEERFLLLIHRERIIKSSWSYFIMRSKEIGPINVFEFGKVTKVNYYYWLVRLSGVDSQFLLPQLGRKNSIRFEIKSIKTVKFCSANRKFHPKQQSQNQGFHLKCTRVSPTHRI